MLDTDFVTALNEETGERLWVAQGQVPQNPTGGSASHPATGKIAVENDVVAAISTFGVLTGFDAATGDERWSIDGYDAAQVTILAQDDVFLISEGFGGFGAGIGAAAGGDQAPEGMESGTVESDAVPAIAAGAACAAHFAPGTSAGSVASPSGTPEAGAQAVDDASFRVQGIDPATGEVVCTVYMEQGTISGAVAAGSSASGVVAVDDDGNLIAIGVISGEDFVLVDPYAGNDDGSAAILTIPDAGASSQVIAVAADDGSAYLQLVDGTLVKVQTAADAEDNDPHEDRDDDRSPESESDDEPGVSSDSDDD